MPRAHRANIPHARIQAVHRQGRSPDRSLDEADLWRDLRECALLLLAAHVGSVVAPIVGALSHPGSPSP
jgi:hypothetical protein